MACMIIVTSPFYWYHAVTLTFDLSQGQFFGGQGPQFFEFLCLEFNSVCEMRMRSLK